LLILPQCCLIFFTPRQWRAEAVGCPWLTWFLDTLENILYSSRKISYDLFSVVHLNFHFFRISCQISREFAPWIPPSAASCPGNDFFTSFLVIYLHFCKKTGPLDAPQGGCPGPSHRPHPPLHATGYEHIALLTHCVANTMLRY